MKNTMQTWAEDTIPYICWDRKWTVAEIRQRLSQSEGSERHRLMAWLMRELKPSEVWFFLKPVDVQKEFEGISSWLGPSQPLWNYLLRTWRELGKL